MANSKIEKKISGSQDDIKTGSLKIGSSIYNAGTISLSPSSATANTGGIIDFHYNQSTNYTGRIIEGNTYISIYGKKLALQAGPLEITYGGTSATTANIACTNLGAVKNSGDTMTGNLIIKNDSLDNTDTSRTASTELGVTFRDKNNVTTGYLTNIMGQAGQMLTTLYCRRYNGTTQVNNSIILEIDKDFNKKIYMNGPVYLPGLDLRLTTTGSNSNDSGDIIWYYGNGQEKMRIFSPDNPSARQGPCFKLFNSAGTALTSQNIALAVVDNFTFTPRDSTVANVGGLGCKCFSDRVYIMDLSLNISKAASTVGQYYKLGTISSGYSPGTNIYTLSHNFSAPFKEIRLTSGGELGIDHAAAISTTTNVRFTLIWVI